MVAVSAPIDVDIKQVFRTIGYITEVAPPTRIMSLVNEYAENAYHLVDPVYSFGIKDVKSVRGYRVLTEDSILFEGEIVAQLLRRCRKVAVFALTIGKYLEDMVSALAEDGLMLQAMVLDAVGSVAVEGLADFVQGEIKKLAAAQGFCISQRFSPGYCGWEVTQQEMVFRALKGDNAGVRLTEGYLMLPQKSVSGIIGIGPVEVENYNPCQTCDTRDNCAWKR